MADGLPPPGRNAPSSARTSTSLGNRRVRVLAQHLARAIPGRGTVLDIGAGDGRIGVALMHIRPDLKVEGIDIAPPERPLVPIARYDGAALPLPDKCVDYVIIVDVLHHTADPSAILREARRVARLGIAIKDHLREGILAGPTLAFLGWAGSRSSGSPPPRTFLTRREWQGEFFRSRLQLLSMNEKLGIHSLPASWLFDRHLHFVAYLTPKDS